MTVDVPDEFRKQMEVVLGTIDADEINRSLLILQVIDSAPPDQRAALLQFVFEEVRSITEEGISKEKKLDPVINRNHFEELQDRYGSLVYQMLNVILKPKPTVDAFYDQLVRIFDNPMFPTEADRAFVMYRLLVDRRLPYFQLDEGLRLSDDDWEALAKRLVQPTSKIRFILASGQKQRSTQADLLLKALDEFEGVERIYLMARLVTEIEDREQAAAAARGRA